ncbi:MAG TPA: ABC transporter permease [Edaphobacter sp.]|nr:ABC transporter permease [Edaphobacter sp.]
MRFLSGIFEKRKTELDEEIQAHIRMDVQNRMERGESNEEAYAAAMKEFGNVPLIKDATHESWRWRRMERLGQDLRYALRSFRRSPGFAVTVIVTLAVGIGSTCAMFTVVDHVLLRSLPYQSPSQLIDVREAGKKGVVNFGSPFLDIQQWRKRSRSLQEIAFYDANKHVSFLEGNTGAMQVSAPKVSAGLFRTLGVHPAMGRGFDERQDTGSVKPEDARMLILSDAVWRGIYGGDEAIIGKTVRLNGESYTVSGVMPREFGFPSGGSLPQVWMPVVLGSKDAVRTRNVTPNYQVIARLKAGTSMRDAEAELKVIQSEVAKDYADPYDREQVTSVSLQRYGDSLVKGDLRKALLALFGASSLLWLIACVNVTSLMLARATTRQREIAVRGALGASRWQIVQQLLIEGLLLSGFASVLGIGMAMGTLKLFEHGLTTQFHIYGRLVPNMSVIGVLLGLTVISALFTSMWPAIGAAKASIEPALRQGSQQNGAGRGQHRARTLLVITEISMSLTLLVGCGLLLRSIYALKHVSLGFRTQHVIVANMTIPAYKFEGRDMRTELYEPLVERVQHLPGVQSAALMTEVPLGKTFQMEFSLGVSGNSAAEVRRRDMRAQFRAVGPETQKVFGFRMLKGRFFNEGDTPSSQGVVVVNRAFVKEYFGDDRDPGAILGESLMSLDKNRQAVVVGVLDDTRQTSVAQQSQPEIQVCLSQITPNSSFYRGIEGIAMDLAVRTERSPALVIPELRKLMVDASPELSASEFKTMDQVVEDSYGSQRLAARLLLIFGGSALLLCIAGIYGLLAYLVAQRTRELGLRMALGAQREDVMWLVLRQAGGMLTAGICIGVALAYLGSLGLKMFLYGVTPSDPWTMGAVTFLLLAGGMAAAYVPARRAAMIDPMQALRTD